MATDMSIFMQFLRSMLLPLPGVTEKMCFDDPAFYVNNKIFTNVKLKNELLALHTVEREKWMAVDPHTFFITDHYLNYKYMLIRLETVSPDDLKTLLITAYLARATKKLIKEYEALRKNERN
ncbi:MmcQ/YjbR family DNA-binding protein [Mucilaginibacter sp.]|uniref:MmcQ/YjbR family DNA-binding protein n=1 Tax=Mucilaginibacter sp. TaxID=1882438 RepID=UPI0025EBDA5E|nr:MmcQ/YjbR family DNA-binding protein [Mucilaginibacter sp.]